MSAAIFRGFDPSLFAGHNQPSIFAPEPVAAPEKMSIAARALAPAPLAARNQPSPVAPGPVAVPPTRSTPFRAFNPALLAVRNQPSPVAPDPVTAPPDKKTACKAVDPAPLPARNQPSPVAPGPVAAPPNLNAAFTAIESDPQTAPDQPPLVAPDPVAATPKFHTLLREYEDKTAVDPPRLLELSWPDRTTARLKKRPKANTLARAWSWLSTQYPLAPAKRMRMVQNIPLGEKRFVALVTVDNREFLIGGGASGVSLLSQWDSEAKPSVAGKQAFSMRESME